MILVLEYRYGHVEGEASSSPRVQALPLSDVSQKSAVRGFDERGGEREGRLLGREEGREKEARVKSRLEFSLSAALFFQSPSDLFLFIASYLPSDPFHSLRALLILSRSHARVFEQASAHPAAIRQDSASASISRLVSIWHRASRPLRHSPVPPHSALLVTPDNWRRNPKFRSGWGWEEKLTSGLALSCTGDIKGCF